MAFVICGRIKKKNLIMVTIRTAITGKFLLSAIITGIKQGFLFMTIFLHGKIKETLLSMIKVEYNNLMFMKQYLS